jgi:mRNA-degrading endonuclease RelE of RelBE toxin-antitoxin system
MIPMRTLFAPLVFASLLAAGSALAASPTVNPAASSATARHHSGQLKNSGLTRELKIMWHKEARAELKAMPKEQRKGWLRRKWGTMSEPQRQAKVAELQAKWNALPANVRQALLERKMQKREAHRMQSDRTNSP